MNVVICQTKFYSLKVGHCKCLYTSYFWKPITKVVLLYCKMKLLNEGMYISNKTVTQTLNEYEGKIQTKVEGYLYMQCLCLWKFPTHLWRRRYFTLKNDTLYFTKDEKDILNQDKTSKIQIEADTGIYPEENKKGKSKYYIKIISGIQRFVLCSTSENERDEWLSSLLTVITQKYVTHFKGNKYSSIKLNLKSKSTKKATRISSEITPEITLDKKENGRLAIDRSESMFDLVVENDLKEKRQSLVVL